MSNLRTRLLGLATAGLVFVGLSYGQNISCTAGTAGAVGPNTNYAPGGGAGTPNINPTIRSESQTELVADYILGCSNTGAEIDNSITVVATLSVPVTSKMQAGVGVAAGLSEATATEASAVALAGAGAVKQVQGTVSGSTITFNGLSVPGGTPAVPAVFTVTIQNVRGNTSGGGAQQVTESAVLQYPINGVSSNVPSASANVGFITASLGAPTNLLAAPFQAPYAACTGNPFPFGGAAPAKTLSIQFAENFAGAFKTQAQENGSFIPAGANAAGIGLAASADSIVLTVSNVPASATVYAGQTVAGVAAGGAANGTTIAITGTPATSPAGIVALGFNVISATPSSGTVTFTYNVTAVAAGTTPGTFTIPVFVVFAGNSTGAQGPITANISYGPNGTIAANTIPTTVPLFLASNFTAAGGPAITLCNTTLLFPFVTNQLGFDTGIVISNTSTDNLAFGGKSIANAQSGTCMLNFYGTGAPAAAVPDPLGSAGVQGTTNPNGPVHAFTLSNSAVAPGFQGYMIASCPFQFAHGFAFITYNLTQQTGVAEGYLAEVLGRGSSAPEAVTF